jgi:hypothetical protein
MLEAQEIIKKETKIEEKVKISVDPNVRSYFHLNSILSPEIKIDIVNKDGKEIISSSMKIGMG